MPSDPGQLTGSKAGCAFRGGWSSSAREGRHDGGMGKNKDSTPDDTVSTTGTGKNRKVSTRKAKIDADGNSDLDEFTSGSSKVPAVVGIVAATVFVVVSIATMFLYSRRNQKLVNELELAELRRSGAAFAKAPQGSALSSESGTAMSWDHDYQMLNARAPRPRASAS